MRRRLLIDNKKNKKDLGVITDLLAGAPLRRTVDCRVRRKLQLTNNDSKNTKTEKRFTTRNPPVGATLCTFDVARYMGWEMSVENGWLPRAYTPPPCSHKGKNLTMLLYICICI